MFGNWKVFSTAKYSAFIIAVTYNSLALIDSLVEAPAIALLITEPSELSEQILEEFKLTPEDCDESSCEGADEWRSS